MGRERHRGRMPDRNGKLQVAVLSCGSLGVKVANRIRELTSVGRVDLIMTPYRSRERSLTEKIRHVLRMQGPGGLLRVAAGKLLEPFASPSEESGPGKLSALDQRITHHRFSDFHDPDALDRLRQLEPDLGVIAGTYILGEEVFSLPRLGCINLHSGKAPEYRGSAPAFWELYNGEDHVGITIHEVTADLDAGRILRQELFPIDTVPGDDPIEFLQEYRREVLRPNGVRLLALTVSDIAEAGVTGKRQDPDRATTYPRPDRKDVRELRRRIEQRRREGACT